MAKYGGTAFALLLVTLTVACDKSSPVGPSPVTPVEPTTPTLSDITITVTLPHFNDSVYVFPGLSGVSVTCLQGCEGQPIETTNDEGLVSFRGTNPITVRLEKPGHVRHEQQMSDGERVFLGHEWPPESAKSFRMLRIPEGIILSWGVADREVGGNFSSCVNSSTSRRDCIPLVTVAKHGREKRLRTMEHELFHAHQSAYPAPYQSSLQHWIESEEGQAWKEAMEADRAAGRVVGLDENPHNNRITENAAEFWTWWRRAENIDSRNLCDIATSRCALMEQWFGPRPASYP